MKKILFLSGSNNPKSINQLLITTLSGLLKSSGIPGHLEKGSYTIVNLVDFPMPMYSIEIQQLAGIPEQTMALKKVVDGHQAIILSVPEHNGSIPAFLKNSLDWLSRAGEDFRIFKNKKIVLLCASPGSGGMNTLDHTGSIVQRLGATVIAKIPVNNFYQRTQFAGSELQFKDPEFLNEILVSLNLLLDNTTPPQSQIITVLGATGKVGSQVIQALSGTHIPSRGLTRSLSKLKALPELSELPEVEWTEGDMNKDTSLFPFLAGSKRLFLNTAVQQNMAEVQCHIIDAAKASGVEYILKLSTPSARQDSKDPAGYGHWQIDEYLKNAGVKWNIIQPQSFMQNWLGDFAATVRNERKIYEAAGEGKRAFTDTRDIGDVARVLFTDPGNWIDKVIPLSGPELVNYYEVAENIGHAIKEKVTYIDQTPEEAREWYRKKGMPEWTINTFLTIAANQKKGLAESLISDYVRLITGKEARSARNFAEDYAWAFR